MVSVLKIIFNIIVYILIAFGFFLIGIGIDQKSIVEECNLYIEEYILSEKVLSCLEGSTVPIWSSGIGNISINTESLI